MLFRSVVLASIAVQSLALLLNNRHQEPGFPKQEQACAALANHETFFTVQVSVGTPPQNFSVVADTGSDSLIIPSCACVERGICNTTDQVCFRGTGASSTFQIGHGPQGPSTAVLSFGSGAIEAALASDEVAVGGVQAFLKNGVLLMTNQALDFSNGFEGILGLGPPTRNPVGKMVVGDKTIDYQQNSPHEVVNDDEGLHPDTSFPDEDGSTSTKDQAGARPFIVAPESKSFLKEAGISRFSVCYKPESDGVLRLGTPPPADAMESCGGEHWGLDFQGVSLGFNSSRVPLSFCQGHNLLPEQKTACAGIPDSGTTALAGPARHLELLISGLCDEWPRCKEEHAKIEEVAQKASKAAVEALGIDPWNIKPKNKTEVMLSLLDDCESWLGETHGGLAELPALHFHVADLNGKKQVLSLPPSAYIFQMEEVDEDSVYQLSKGMRNYVRRERTKQNRTVCAPAFQPIEYSTPENGHLWILGMPIFYHYQIHYNLDAESPTIAFSDAPCGVCNSDGTSPLTGTGALDASTSRVAEAPYLRKIKKPLRTRTLNPSRPL